MRGGEQDGQRSSLGLPQHRGLVGAYSVHHRPDVVHALFKRPYLDPVRKPHSPLVEHNQPTERAE